MSEMEFNLIFHLLFLSTFTVDVDCSSVTIHITNASKEINISGSNGEELILELHMPFYSQKLLITKEETEIAAFSKNASYILQQDAFANEFIRFTKTDKNMTTHVLLIKKLTFQDQTVLRMLLTNETKILSSTTLHINVYGGAEVCGSKKSLIIKSNPLMVTDIICGNPKPVVHWYIDNKSISHGEIHAKNMSKYVIRKIFPKPPVEHCGKYVSYKARGYRDVLLIHSLLFIFSFTPASVQIISAQIDENCVTTKWKIQNTGLCNLTYDIEFRNSKTSKTFYKVNITGALDQYVHCFEKAEQPRHAVVIYMRARFLSMKGNWSFIQMKVTHSTLDSKILYAHRKKNCITAQWRISKGENRTREIQLLDNGGQILYVFNISTTKKEVTKCFNNINLAEKVSKVALRVLHVENKGAWSYVDVKVHYVEKTRDKNEIVHPSPKSIGIVVAVMMLLFLIMCLLSHYALRRKARQAGKAVRIPEPVVEEDKCKPPETNGCHNEEHEKLVKADKEFHMVAS